MERAETWWTGVLGDQQGIFPSNFVQLEPDTSTTLKMVPKLLTDNITPQLTQYEEITRIRRHKFGVVYVPTHCSSEEDLFTTNKLTKSFKAFMNILGEERIRTLLTCSHLGRL